MLKRALLAILFVGILAAGAKLTRHYIRLMRVKAAEAAAVQAAPPQGPPRDAIFPRDPDFQKPTRLDAWEIIGPGGGGTFHSPAISPHDPNLVFASTDMGSSFVTENGGKTWRSFNLRFPPTFVFDPKRPERVYAIGRDVGLYRSDDRGHTWSLVYPDPSTNPAPHYGNNEGETRLQSTNGWPGPITGLAIDPDDSDTIYASIDSQLRMSTDAGKTWKLLVVAPLNGYADPLLIDPASPRGKRAVLMIQGPQVSVWDGTKYAGSYIPEPRPERHGVAYGRLPATKAPVLYALEDLGLKDGKLFGGVHASMDGGITWRSLNEGLLKLMAKDTYPEPTAIATSRNHADVIYVSLGRMQALGDSTASFGVVKSSDGGATWTILRKESGTAAENIHDSWVSRRFGPDWSDEPLFIGVDDNNPDLVYTADLGRLLRSRDGGRNWNAVYSQSTGRGYTTTGLDNTTCYGVHFDPFDNRRMFISYTDIGLFRSEDGGESWISATANGVPSRWKNTTYWLEFDPAVKGKMWAVMTDTHDLPLLKMFRRLPAAHGGVVLSTDGGKTWKVSNGGLPDIAPTHIVLDPTSPVNARVLYITAFGKGVYKSVDGGQNWVAKNRGLPEKDPYAWRMARDKNGTLYLVTTRKSEDGNYGNDQDGWLFRSTDGAESWVRVPLPTGLNGPNGIEVDPQDPQRLYLPAWARYKLYDDGRPALQGGVFLSTDGGQHWTNVLDATLRMYDVTVDPRNPDIVYAAGSETAAYRSIDRGRTWSRIGGFNFKAARRVIPDPVDPSKIYIATFGASVWHGPAAGDPKAVEDIVSPRSMTFQFASAPKGKSQ